MSMSSTNSTRKKKFNVLLLLEPIVVLAIIGVLVIPALVAVNLTPETRGLDGESVLGAKTENLFPEEALINKEILLTLIINPHDAFSDEELLPVGDDVYKFTAKISPENSQQTKPVTILKIKNATEIDTSWQISGNLTSRSENVYFVIDGIKLKLADRNGTLLSQRINVNAGEEKFIAVQIDFGTKPQYTEELGIYLKKF